MCPFLKERKMANLGAVNIQKGVIGSNTVGTPSSISGLIVECSIIGSSGLGYFQHRVLKSLDDAKALGLDDDYDTNNNVVVFRHIKEFFRMAGEGSELHFMIAPRNFGVHNMFIDTPPGSNDAPVKKLMMAAEGKIRQIAVAANPTSTATPPYLDGIHQNVRNAITPAQQCAVWAYDNYMPVRFLIEGRAYKGNPNQLIDFRTLDAPNVAVVIGQDYDHAHSFPNPVRRYADVGTALGTLSAASIEQNIGDNTAFSLTNKLLGIWVTPGLSSHDKNSSVYNELQQLEDKGAIFGITYVGLEGVRWNGDHTCVEVILDNQGNINEHTLAYGRTIDEVVRALRSAYLPHVKTSKPVDPQTGLLPKAVVKFFDGVGNDVFADFINQGKISAGLAITDPNSDLLVEKKLKVNFKVVPYGTIGEITGTINLKSVV